MNKELKDTKMKKILKALPLVFFTIIQIVCLYLLYFLTVVTVHFSAEYGENVLMEHIILTILFLAVPIVNIYVLVRIKKNLRFKFLIQLAVLGIFSIVYLITINII